MSDNNEWFNDGNARRQKGGILEKGRRSHWGQMAPQSGEKERQGSQLHGCLLVKCSADCKRNVCEDEREDVHSS